IEDSDVQDISVPDSPPKETQSEDVKIEQQPLAKPMNKPEKESKKEESTKTKEFSFNDNVPDSQSDNFW
ncbi:hypothetical protein D7X33_36570, partial [Butyricicoccus sp. 1XD8-22]